MCASPFQKRHKRRKAHDDHNVTSDTALVVGTSFMCLCGTDKSVLSIFFFHLRLCSRKCRRMQDTTSVNLHLRLFPAVRVPCPQTVLPHFCQTGQWRARPFDDKCRRKNTRDRKPCPHDNDGHGTSVTAAGKRCFPLVVAPPFDFPHGASRHPTLFSLFLSASPNVCQCSHAAFPDGISGHFRCWGKGNSGIVRGCKVGPPCGCPEKSPPSQAQVVFYPANLASPNPYL